MGTVRQTKNKNIGSIFKKIALICVQIATMVQLQACKGGADVSTDSIFTPLKTRIDQNIEQVKTLQSNGFLDANTAQTILKKLDTKKNEVSEVEKNVNETLAALATTKDAVNAEELLTELEDNNNLSEILSSFDAVWIPQVSYDQASGEFIPQDVGKEHQDSAGDNDTTYENLGISYHDIAIQYLAETNNVDFGQLHKTIFTVPLAENSKKLTNIMVDGTTKVQAYQIVDQEVIDQLRQQTTKDGSGKVYVLDYNKVQAMFGQGASTEELTEILKAIADGNKFSNGNWQVDTTIQTSTGRQIQSVDALDKLFQVATDADGQALTWIDLAYNNQDATIAGTSVLGTNPNDPVKGVHTEVTNATGLGQPEGWQDAPGYDVRIHTSVGGTGGNTIDFTIAYLRVNDLYSDTVKQLTEAVEKGKSDRMIYVNGNFYLMTYPIAVIDTLQTDGSGTYQISYKTDDSMLLNFSTGEMLNVQQTTASEAGQVQAADSYIGLGDQTIQNYQQFIVSDVTGQVNIAGEMDKRVAGTAGNITQAVVDGVPAFVLRDYLEGSYTPGVLNDGNVDESLVCYGRLLRFNLQGATGEQHNIADTIAYYIDQQHSKISKTGFSEVYPWQLANAADLFTAQTSDHKIKRLPQQQESVGSTTNGDPQATNVQNLPQETVSQISPVAQFPGDLDRWDADKSGNTQKPRMYAVATTLDLNQSGILNHWMQSEDQQLSLAWWQTWLNSHSYNYHLTDDVINKWINAEYNIVLGQRDFVIMDTDKINKTNNTFVDKALSKASTTWKTFMVFIGIVCVIIQTVFILCWTFDVVVGLDLHLTEKIQGGKYTAVKDRSELMNMYGYMGTGRFNGYSGMGGHNSGPRPIDFVGVLCKILWLMGLGIILMTVNPLTIFQVVLKLAQGIAKISENVTAGIIGG